MVVDTVRMSSKGQIVIPQHIRDVLGVEEGSVFAVMGEDDTVVLRKIKTPSKKELIKELTKIAREGKKRLKEKGIKEKDIPSIVERSRRKGYE